ncbi:hypothetical protein COT86_02045 [Candidatus Collierbacteria bacterium CG10_big_fil_rev_8_21_14_0_10_43_36]|uniref:Uncharacterized protein n=2 Tax=Candidatus Collieribacteriota TaxID=1752725 RepID=A0A2H0DTW1_9BACT|nr:MAG: hypothetical protein COW83_03320 [Candidatus Collierbacteria bacterium CG22_combo_CG10-13_8_21_14_all_43_12]PIR99799.1 MAG: hypothetical protein COT86_02045 [Candidatus Collierbacteria bacterium CG10_big_fil_rev_8_21_14_0_10_43_36]
MPDKILICQNCKNPFVYSDYEQNLDQKKISDHSSRISDNIQNPHQAPRTNHLAPPYCPICTSIKASEAKHPSKPKNPPTK